MTQSTLSTSDMIGTAEACRLLGWSRAKVKREAKAGRLPFAVKMPGCTGAYLFHRAIIEMFAKRVAAWSIRRHPADVTADRLIHHYEKWYSHLEGSDREAVGDVIEWLRNIAIIGTHGPL